jgi:tripartite-type tricarboxylate transporter receptor subunit TctC
MAKGLQDELGKPFVIDNRGGAGGNIGTDIVAKAVPDGHMLLITSSAPVAINPSIYKKMPFDPAKDLAPVTNLIRVPLVLTVNPSVPAKNLQELIAYLKSRKDMQYASSGNGTPQHLTGELFKTTAASTRAHPIQGLGARDHRSPRRPCASDVRQHDCNPAAHQGGQARAIAVTSSKRSPQLPTCRHLPRPACRASNRTRGTASSRLPRRRRT